MRRPIAAAIIAAALLAANLSRDRQLVLAQEPDRIPGPIIEDPPGPFTGPSYVASPSYFLSPAAVSSTFVVTYNGFSPQAQSAFQAAVSIWASQIQSTVPIRVTANWTNLGTGILGSAGPRHLFRNFPGAPYTSTWFPVAVANKLSGVDLAPNDDDIVANFNSSFNWYLGTDGNAGTQHDLMTVVLHELGHGLGFLGSMNGSSGSWGALGSPYVYDLFAINGSGQSLINTTLFPNPSSALAAQLTSSNVFFTGLNAWTANSGTAPKLFTPNPWLSGSSYSHLDESTYPNGNLNSLMTYSLGAGEAIHDPGPVARGLLFDLGWTGGGGCSYSLSSASFSTSAVATTGSVNVTSGPGCAWVATSNSSWIAITSGAAGNGNGTVNFSLSANSGLTRTGTLTIAGQTFTVTQANRRAATDDFDGDGKADITIYRPSSAQWWVLRSSSNSSTYAVYGWGIAGDIPVPADYDGDGKTDLAIYRPSNGQWWVLRSSSNYSTFFAYTWGIDGDIPVPGDYDGDGKADPAIYRPSNGQWWVLRSSSNYSTHFAYTWGIDGDIPVRGDYDGDGKADPAIYRPSNGQWWVLRSSSNYSTHFAYTWGIDGDIPVRGDYDGDGKADPAIYRPSNGQWWVLRSSSNYSTHFAYTWGIDGDIPVRGDYDGDGKADPAIYRPSNGQWWVLRSSSNYSTHFAYTWGIGGDIPTLELPQVNDPSAGTRGAAPSFRSQNSQDRRR